MEFTKEILAGHLRPRNVEPTPVKMGGNVSIQRLAEEMTRLYWTHDAVTSLVDFYGFKQKGSATADGLETEVRDQVRKNIRRVRRDWDARKVLPYVQRHEFEALLFADVDSFLYIGIDQEGVGQLQDVRSQFETPEDINDDRDTAPSKRILQVVPSYDKVVQGTIIAAEVGLEKICSACPRFRAWLARLEALGTR